MQKLKFDARNGATGKTADLYESPWRFSFIHNFKVHYKRGALQAFSNKLDISLNTPRPDIPSTEQVMSEFNERMKASLFASDTKHRFAPASYHVTQVEYKQSIALSDSRAAAKVATRTVPDYLPEPGSPMLAEDDMPLPGVCRGCGAGVTPDSAFCNRCGSPIV